MKSKKTKEFQAIKKERICTNCQHYRVEKNKCLLYGAEIINTLCCKNYIVKQKLCSKCKNEFLCIFEKLNTFDNEEIIKCNKYTK